MVSRQPSWLYAFADFILPWAECRYMRVDAAASRALNVLPQRLDGSANFSLYGIMARAKTAMGKRLLKVSLAGPCCNLE
jgi:DNA mismatch repair protein MSH2